MLWNTTAKALMAATLMAVAALSAAPAAQADEQIALPPPRMEGGAPLLTALARRQSIRAYGAEPLAPQTLSDLLWAAGGINRPGAGERTAPSWRGSKAIDIYVATPEAVLRYNPAAHALVRVMAGDIRPLTGRQPFAGTAPVVLIYVADRSRMPEAPAPQLDLYAHVDAALVAQNVYLFAASEGLGTVMLGNVDKPDLVKALNLRDDQILTFTQPVGHPR
jgi:nitroreductase